MKRANYYNYVEAKLLLLVSQIESRGKLNILDFHSHSENFFRDLLNRLFDWQLENINAAKQNTEGIDLIDATNKIVVQVSSISTKQKVESALSKDLSSYSEYSFKFVPITLDAKGLRGASCKNPHNLCFSADSDIYDIRHILKAIVHLDIVKQKSIYEFIKRELGNCPDLIMLETNLANIIKVLSGQDWDSPHGKYQTVSFEIEQKIDYNELNLTKSIISEFAVHSSRLDKLYKEFDKQGVNKSRSVLASIQKMYISSSMDSLTGDALFLDVIEQAVQTILNSANHSPMPFEELEMCISILVVDAFVRCKIFKKPEGHLHAATS